MSADGGQLLGVEYVCRMADLDAVGKHKAPYADDDGEIIEESTFIRWHFEKKMGRAVDAELSSEQRAAAWGLERMLEDRLSHVMVIERWLESDNFERGPSQFFAGVPEQAREAVTKEIRDGLRAAHQRVGLLRHSRAERMQLAERDIAAVSEQLGDKEFMFGANPTSLDGAAFGVIEAARAPIFDTPMIKFVERCENLDPYLTRMKARFFAKSKWGAAA